jgi:hypothetical protein
MNAHGLGLRHPIMVQKSLRFPDRIRPAQQFVSETLRRHGDEAMHRAANGFDAVFMTEVDQAFRAKTRAADLRADISEDHVGDATIVADDRLDRFLRSIGGGEADGGQK